ncbi:MAG: hypothetical protein ABL962_09365, partial [Fimbriimonadaceae bacterium]
MMLLPLFAMASQMMSPEPLDPHTYSSPSGEYRLYVNPEDSGGQKGASYSFSQKGKLKWQKRLPYAMRKAIVTDKGHSCGYADPLEIRAEPDSFLHLAILGPDGREILHEKLKQKDSDFMHAHPVPNVDEIAASSESDTFIATLSQGGAIAKTYRVSTGKPFKSSLPKAITRANMGRYPIAMRYIPGTPLLLVNWWNPNFPVDSDAEFELYDPNAKCVWRYVRKRDYKLGEYGTPHDASEIQQTGAILGVSTGQFTLRMLQADLRLKFGISRSGATYVVKEIGRSKFVTAKPVAAVFPAKKLQALPSLQLASKATKAAPAVSQVGEFSMGEPHQFATLSPDFRSLMVFTEAGKVVKKMA